MASAEKVLLVISAKEMVNESCKKRRMKVKKRSIALYKFCGFVGWEKIAGEQIFSNPAAFMKSLLCIPHPNASTKRTFSMVLKIITENRTSLHSDTVCALLNCKLNCDRIAAGFKPFKLQLNAAK